MIYTRGKAEIVICKLMPLMEILDKDDKNWYKIVGLGWENKWTKRIISPSMIPLFGDGVFYKFAKLMNDYWKDLYDYRSIDKDELYHSSWFTDIKREPIIRLDELDFLL